ncbi:penicillin amidase [Kordiimonas sediminis]|uniref:Penicillin amidase n=1 Tax=Kordiimonas sediminis TaxID=1735581 RepID=A0A919E8K3_9PROT|nr:acylase [Kordiimonas sediminis]GHF23828.1 penicillin amidase [Kordiimonas sediminis]
MRHILLILFTFICVSCSQPTPEQLEVSRWQEQAKNVTIIRDEWGIPHVYGKTDADAVFGMIYAQAEDDFNRIEVNYLNAMGRLAEAEGESELYRDLRMKMFIDPAEIQQQYEESPEWLKKLMNAFADGLNYYLHTHPEVKPRVLTRFEPWMALTFTEGSIGGDIESFVSMNQLENFYGDRMEQLPLETTDLTKEPSGSNGFAIAPSNSATGNALLLINPHTSFYFRAELQMASEEGLNAYGAVTWGQFFVYQGFNEKTGWMHTSSKADAVDYYLETVSEKEDGYYYLYDGEERKLTTKEITLPYKTDSGMEEKQVTVYYSHHGPIIRSEGDKWVSVKLMHEPIKALTQSYTRTKATGYKSFAETMDILTNSSNNTVYADAEGNIAYWHGNFIPRRDPSYDWRKPVDGSTSATEWQGLHPVSEHITLLNPSNGWLMNTNNWPFSAAGENSPKRADYPLYMSNNTENPRGIHAIKVLEGKTDFTIESLREAAYDSYLTAFDTLLPALFDAYDATGDDDPFKEDLKAPVEALRGWDKRYSVDSVPTSVAIFWGQELMREVMQKARDAEADIYEYMAGETTPEQRVFALLRAVKKLEKDFGTWQTPWGDINRFQRLTGDIVQPFDDSQPSYPVAFPSARWGSLAAYGQRTFNGTKKIYGTRGNSFVAIVEFGDKVRAKAITAGGQSGDPQSPHFYDQAELYSKGLLRDVHYYRADVEANAKRTYSPGQ